MHWFPVVDAWARDRGMDLVPLVRSGCVVAGELPPGPTRRERLCREWTTAPAQRIRDTPAGVTVVSLSTGARSSPAATRSVRAPNPMTTWSPRRLLGSVADGSDATVLLSDVPRPGFSVPDCLGVRRWDPAACAMPVADVAPEPLRAAEAEAAARPAGMRRSTPPGWLCEGGTCSWIIGTRVGWIDDHRITSSAAIVAAAAPAPVFDAAVGT
jgi:hypothetical protein